MHLKTHRSQDSNEQHAIMHLIVTTSLHTEKLKHVLNDKKE